MSSNNLEPRWPPRSPHEALLSSPGGRNKLRQNIDRTSPTPSPLKKSSTTPNLTRSYRKVSRSAGSDEEDEETLQLELQALEARLKLKRLQAKKNKTPGKRSDKDDTTRLDNAAKENRPPSLDPAPIERRNGERALRSPNRVEVEASPQKSLVVKEETRSPKKVLLGIDKGLTGRNVSLRRVPNETASGFDPFGEPESSHWSEKSKGLSRSRSTSHLDGASEPKSFSEKIADLRQEDKRKSEYASRMRREQSTGFGVRREDIDRARQATNQMQTERKPDQCKSQSGYSREDILKATNQAESHLIRKSAAPPKDESSRDTQDPSRKFWKNPNVEPGPAFMERTTPNTSKPRVQRSAPDSDTPRSPSKKEVSPASSSCDPLFEPFSMTHLSRRLLPHDLLTRTFAKKSILLLPHLLQHVKSPSFCLPEDLEVDYVVLATIASKSNPLTHKDSVRAKFSSSSLNSPNAFSEAVESEQNNKGKYMVLTLTDLKWTLDLYLFDTAYTRFWKLDPGTVIAILNPSIMPPPPGRQDTGRFSLVLNSSDDTVLEIGTSRDLGWCSSVRKDGKQCPTWVDKRHTSVCEFHVDRVVERTRSGRMEVQGMSAPFAPGGRKGGRTGQFGTGRGGKKRGRADEDDNSRTNTGLLREGAQYDRGSRSTYFMAPPPLAALAGGRGTVAQLLDAELGPLERGGSKEERLRKRLADREREDTIARQLGEGGNGAGSEYLRLRRRERGNESSGKSATADSSMTSSTASSALPSSQVIDAGSLGLKTNLAQSVQLSPLKNRKRGSGGIVAESGSGGGIREGGSSNIGSARKKTRFVTEKGIREAGRESLGGQNGKEEVEGHGLGCIVDQEDDDLEVI